MYCRTGRLCLWPFALYMAFPCSLSGRDSTDYYDQSAPSIPMRPKSVCPDTGEDRWFLGSCLVTGMGWGWLPNTFSLTGSLRTGFFMFAGTGTFRSFAPVSSPSYARRFTVLLASQTMYASRVLVMSRLRQLPANPFHPF